MLPVEVKVLNMSLTGLAIEAQLSLPIGGRHVLTLRHEADMIQVEAEVQWCRPAQPELTLLGEVPSRWEIGLDFSRALDEQAQELLGFLQHNVVIEVGPGFRGRLWMAEESTESGSHEFELEQLSFSDVLIETGAMPEIDDICVVELRKGRLELQIKGKVIDAKPVRRASGRTVSEVRIAFQELSPDSQRTLEELVEYYLE